jgi:gallate decarboxylase subunit C
MFGDPELAINVTIHRLCLQDKEKITIFRQRQEAKDQAPNITINMDLDPATYIGAEFEMPTVPVGYDELRMAGDVRQELVKLVDDLTVKEIDGVKSGNRGTTIDSF